MDADVVATAASRTLPAGIGGVSGGNVAFIHRVVVAFKATGIELGVEAVRLEDGDGLNVALEWSNASGELVENCRVSPVGISLDRSDATCGT